MAQRYVKHVLVTRFNNVLNRQFPHALDEDWLRHRWRLFEQITLPSIAGQSTSEFDWVVQFHEASPRWLLERAAMLELPCRVRPFIGQGDPRTAPELADLHDASVEALLVTRLDSDDALDRTALAQIRESYTLDPDGAGVLTFQVGYQLDRATARLRLFFHYSPPFSTLVHRPPIDRPLDFGSNHWRLPNKYPFRAIDGGQPMYLQTVHGWNIRNSQDAPTCLVDEALSAHILRTAFHVDAEQLLGICRHESLSRALRHRGPPEQSTQPRR